MDVRFSRFPLLSAVVLAVAVTGSAGAQDQPQPASAAATTTGRHVLPLLDDKVPEAYRAHVPLPFGVSFNYFRLDERLALSDPVLVFNGQPVPGQLIQVDSLKVATNSYTLRFDAWIFPFLDVYTTATRFSGEASDIRASVIGFPPVIPSSLDYNGTGVGAGLTAAFGYRAFFASYDYSYHWQFMELPSNTVKVAIQGPRVGIQFTPWGVQGNAYVGAMKESIFGRQTGTITLPGAGSIAFDLVAGPEHAWNPMVGVEIGLTRHVRANVEAGFSGRTALLLGAGYRF
jgi:hypothetical protein